MSRIGKKPIKLPAGVKVTLDGRKVTVAGPKASLDQVLPPQVTLVIEPTQLVVNRDNETPSAKALHGLARSLVNNMVQGVTAGYKKELEIRGVGYRASVTGTTLVLLLGYSHQIHYEIPAGIKIAVADNTRLTIEGSDKQMVGQAAASIRAFKTPEVYKGKGIRYVGEYVAQKEGKSVK